MTLERITEVCGGVYYGSEADKKKEIAGAVIDMRIVHLTRVMIVLPLNQDVMKTGVNGIFPVRTLSYVVA